MVSHLPWWASSPLTEATSLLWTWVPEMHMYIQRGSPRYAYLTYRGWNWGWKSLHPLCWMPPESHSWHHGYWNQSSDAATEIWQNGMMLRLSFPLHRSRHHLCTIEQPLLEMGGWAATPLRVSISCVSQGSQCGGISNAAGGWAGEGTSSINCCGSRTPIPLLTPSPGCRGHSTSLISNFCQAHFSHPMKRNKFKVQRWGVAFLVLFFPS